LCLAMILLAHDRFARRGRSVDFFLLCLAWAVLFLSVTINIVVIVVAFAIGHQLVSARFRVNGGMLYLVLATASGFLVSYPDTLAFWANVRASVRITQGFGGAHISIANHVFLPVAGLAV